MKAHAVFHEIMFKDQQMTTDRIELRSIGGGHAIAVVTTTNDSFTTLAMHSNGKALFFEFRS